MNPCYNDRPYAPCLARSMLIWLAKSEYRDYGFARDYVFAREASVLHVHRFGHSAPASESSRLDAQQ